MFKTKQSTEQDIYGHNKWFHEKLCLLFGITKDDDIRIGSLVSIEAEKKCLIISILLFIKCAVIITN